ncbi:MAG: formate dehydrogenase subunit delta [Croceibacterium sp.]
MSATEHGGGTLPKLRRMAEQIALNFAAIGHDDAVLATADHIYQFWDPRMKAAIFADDRGALSPIARGAIDHLAGGAHPASQTRATEFNTAHETGHSDAG